MLTIFVSVFASAQMTSNTSDSLTEYTSTPVSVYTAEYLRAYNNIKKKVVKLYPYALYAAELIDEIEENSKSIEKRRKQNKFYKDSYSDLKGEFKYFILDLYRSEGRFLMKLVNRETGMTIYEISEKYRGGMTAQSFKLMAKVWDQDLDIRYDSTNAEGKITEHVISDIQAGIIEFNDEFVPLDKAAYKEAQIAYKERVKKNRKVNRTRAKAFRKKQRKAKRLKE